MHYAGNGNRTNKGVIGEMERESERDKSNSVRNQAERERERKERGERREEIIKLDLNVSFKAMEMEKRSERRER